MPKEDWAKNTVKTIFSDKDLWPWKDEEIVSVLDVACGLSFKSKFISAQIRVGVDIYDEYFKHIETEVPHVLVKYDVRHLEDIFPDKSFDLVIALDIIEHLEKEESLNLIQQCEKIARKGVILETPNGYVPQNLDITGHGGHEFQSHRCGWEVKELEGLGYQCVVRDYRMSDIQRHTEMSVDSDIQLIGAIKFL